MDETHFLWELVLGPGQVEEGQEQLSVQVWPALLEWLDLVLHENDHWWLEFWLTLG